MESHMERRVETLENKVDDISTDIKGLREDLGGLRVAATGWMSHMLQTLRLAVIGIFATVLIILLVSMGSTAKFSGFGADIQVSPPSSSPP